MSHKSLFSFYTPKNTQIMEEKNKKLVYDIKLSSVAPGKITGENKLYNLKGIDLAMKLHYIKALYFFTNHNYNNIINGSNSFISILELKKPMFDWLIGYFMVCGRVRSSFTEDRPTIKLNDAGIRIVEAKSDKTVEEWLAMEGFICNFQDQLVCEDDNGGLGPDLPFSPLVWLQVTWFKCGGISVGLSWAHILGDAFSASEFMNMLGQYMQGSSGQSLTNHHQQPKIICLRDPPQPEYPPRNTTREPVSLKRVNPVGSHWVIPSTNCKMGTYTFILSPKQVDELHSRVHGSKMNDNNSTSQCFEVITTIMWKSIAKIRKDLGTNVVTICRPGTTKRQKVVPYNGQVIGTVETTFSVSSVDPMELIQLVVENVVDESDMVEELVNKEMGKHDFVVYGTHLTFVDMEEANVYGFEIKGKRPRFASYTIGGIGDKGVIVLLPGPEDGINGGIGSKLITTFLPEDEIELLKSEFKEEWCIE